MGVDIQVSSRYLDRAPRLIGQGLAVEVFRPGLEGEEEHPFPGKATVIDNTIDPTTSTFLVQAEVANPAKTILPGEYVKVNAKVVEARDAVVVPEQAVVETAGRPDRLHRRQAGQGGGRPRPGDLHLRGPPRPRIGPQPGQPVIVEGLQLVRSGITVKTRPASPDDPDGPEGPAATPPGADRRGRDRRPAGGAGRRAGPGPAAEPSGREPPRRPPATPAAEAVTATRPGRARPGTSVDADPRPRERDAPWSTSSSAGRSSPRSGPADAPDRRHLRLRAADRAVSPDRPAPGPGHDDLHRRRRPDRRRDGHHADRAADQRHQGDDLLQLRQHQQRRVEHRRHVRRRLLARTSPPSTSRTRSRRPRRSSRPRSSSTA